jgi:hypothetical protein
VHQHEQAHLAACRRLCTGRSFLRVRDRPGRQALRRGRRGQHRHIEGLR